MHSTPISSGASEEVNRLSVHSEKINTVLEVIKGIARSNQPTCSECSDRSGARWRTRSLALRWLLTVRTLTGRTQLSTEEISTIIKGVQDQTQTVINTIQNCCEKATAVSTLVKRHIQESHRLLPIWKRF
ncbi:hypothetical protein O9929_20885 [Vibrio lentus]|nr:hypothetical protein [Vibrio lentus]